MKKKDSVSCMTFSQTICIKTAIKSYQHTAMNCTFSETYIYGNCLENFNKVRYRIHVTIVEK